MAKSDYIVKPDLGFSAQLQTYKNNIPSYSGVLNTPTTQIGVQAADAAYFDYVLRCLAIIQNSAQQWAAWKDLIRGGGTPPSSGAPVAPVLPTPAVGAVAPGVEPRFRGLAQNNKKANAYNQSIGETLGIEGPDQTAPDLTALQPLITATTSGSRVEVGWGWQGNTAFLDMCELQVDRGDGKGFAVLAYDTTPGYVDTMPLPAAPAKWTYKAIYRVEDAQVGQWSNPVSVTVGG